MLHLISINSRLLKEVAPVLNDAGTNVDAVITMALERIVREKSISFLTATQENPIDPPDSEQNADMGDDRISKARAIALFEAQGIRFNHNVTFASKNRSANNYWANPHFTVLDKDWFFILNDWHNQQLHLFVIPAKSIRPEELVCRADQPDRIDLQIGYNDPSYSDNRSRMKFSNYLVMDLSY